MAGWVDSPECRSHAHCAACRASADFRRSLRAAAAVESEDFACPSGYSAAQLPALTFPVRVRRKDCATCLPMTPEEMRRATN